MSFIKRFASIEKKFAWGFLAFVIGVPTIAFALYSTFHESNPNISVVSINETNVLDVHKPLEELTISFQGKDIEEENLNLRILTIKVENSGEVDILQNYYDVDDIWGIQVQNGEIIEARLVDSNSDYIKSNLNPTVTGEENIVEFRKVIFEREKFFTLEILVLHEKDKLPQIMPIGKIAGIDKITVVKYQAGEAEQNFLAQLISGNVGVHIVRSIMYLVAALVTVVVIVFFAAGAVALRDNRRKAPRKRMVKRYWGSVAPKEGSKKKILSDMYVDRGAEGFRKIKVLLEDENKLRGQVRKYELVKKRSKERGAEEITAEVAILEDAEQEHLLRRLKLWPISDLLEKGIVTPREPDQVLVDTEFKQLLDQFLEYLESQEET